MLSAAAHAQNLSDRFKAGMVTWEAALLKGDAAAVRKSLETLLQQESARINSSDYNEMHTVVGAYSLAARACVQEGSWEDALAYLQKASEAANANLANLGPEGAFAKLRKEHEAKLPEWRDLLAKQENRLKEMEGQPGLTVEQMKLRQQLRGSIEEVRNAITNSEKALKTIDATSETLRKEADQYAKSLADWQAFMAKEKAEMDQAGPLPKYVSEKMEQVKADDVRPRSERLAYGRRLLHLDPANPDCKRFVNGLLGIDDEQDVPKTKPSGKKGGKKKT
jgi:tetratricopeptide (TPR) repeat protein